ncbi:unnamed protein product [Lymnaea stagnalis]|uniref:G-protein coupled receptors family 1 profile domain-containing protein n=1 Tax=Lymnaea stagnalis TaxID=6523 RepID=A0AAV2HES1_LYMST
MYYTTTNILDINMENSAMVRYSNINTTVSVNLWDNEDYLGEVNDPSYHSIHKVAILLVKVLFPVFVAVGTVSNILIIVVLRRGAINTDNLSFFLSALAVVDTVFLYTSAFKSWIRVIWGVEFLHFGSWSCKLGLFLNHLSLTLSAWLVVVIAWQRWYTCSRPFDRCCPVESARCGYIGLACLVLVLVGANSYVLVTAEYHESSWGRSCAPAPEHDGAISEVFPYLLVLLYSGLPALLLIVLNGLLARVLYTSRRSLLSHTESSRTRGRHDGHVRARYNYVTVLLLALSLSWLVLTSPHTLLKFAEHIPESSFQSATFTFLNVLFFIFLYVNHSINFFLYCALTKGFRREVRRIASNIKSLIIFLSHSCCSRPRRQHLDASNTNSHHSHTDSFMPLLEQNVLKYRQAHNGYNLHPAHGLTAC